METIEFVVAPTEVGERLDRLLAHRIPDLSRARAQRLIRAGAVAIGAELATKSSQSVDAGALVAVQLRTRPPDMGVEPEAIPLQVIYEDDDLAVIDKAAGIVMHPAPGHATGTLVHALAHRFGNRLAAVADGSRPGIVHRLDRGTSGVVVVALTDRAHQHLAAQFAARTVRKEYLALVYGDPDQDSGTIDVPLGRDPRDRKRISARAHRSRSAVTDWQRLESFPGFALIEARPRTGRTHQIRVHLAHMRHAIVGDDEYSGRQWKGVPEGRTRSLVRNFGRPALHACRLEFEHPSTGARVAFEAPLAADFAQLLATLREWRDAS